MTKKYNQLTLEQRYKIEALRKAGTSLKAISEILGIYKSTISRELKRNVSQRGIGSKIYDALRAQHKTNCRHQSKPKTIYLHHR